MDINNYEVKEGFFVLKEKLAIQYRKVIRKQLEEWVKGNNLHTDEIEKYFGVEFKLPEGMEKECCPDFSCCNKNVKTEERLKQVFFNACESNNENLCNEILLGFMSDTFNIDTSKIHIVGLSSKDKVLS